MELEYFILGFSSPSIDDEGPSTFCWIQAYGRLLYPLEQVVFFCVSRANWATLSHLGCCFVRSSGHSRIKRFVGAGNCSLSAGKEMDDIALIEIGMIFTTTRTIELVQSNEHATQLRRLRLSSSEVSRLFF